MLCGKISENIENGLYQSAFTTLYPKKQAAEQKHRYLELLGGFEALFGAGRDVDLFSAPGRTEIGGNHTDHQRGRVLAASINLDILCAASKNDLGVIRIKSAGYKQDDVDLAQLDAVPAEKNRGISLIRGIAARFVQLGYKIGGFDACTTSDVLKGSGLSSSAALEVAIGTILNHLYNDGALSAVQIAQIGQYAENTYFGKPCGLLDQTASSVGGFVSIDFCDPEHPIVEPVSFDFAASGHTLCVVDTAGDHADLTDDYAAITDDMREVAEFFGAQYLREVAERDFFRELPAIRRERGERAALRAMHFFADNHRVKRQVTALRENNFERFKELIIESGRSSFMYLQNIFSCGHPDRQELSLALALSEKLLGGRGAWRVHGGGFGGTIQAFVPNDMLADYKTAMEAVFGLGNCHELIIRPVGGIKISADAPKA